MRLGGVTEVTVVRDAVRDVVDVYLLSRGERLTLLVPTHTVTAGRDVDPLWTTVMYDDGSRVPPSFSLPPHLAHELAKALTDVVAPDHAMADHLKDAIQVRDRLLTLVEHRVGRGRA